MKKFSSLFIFFLLFISNAEAQNYADAIIGKWKSEDQKTIVEIFKSGENYFGKIIWMSVPNDISTGGPRTDKENPDPEKRNRKLMGLPVLFDLEFVDGFWQDGEIYNSQNGETYDVDIWLEGNDVLKLKIKWYLMHETQSWTRVK